ncbi:MAG: hypothetical protein ABJM29_10560 [Rhizobiaceae bacterium]
MPQPTQKHLRKFHAKSQIITAPGGEVPSVWHKKHMSTACKYLDINAKEQIYRNRIKLFRDDPNCSDEELYSTIMSWGRISRFNVKHCKPNFTLLQPLLSSMRAGRETRKTAYDKYLLLKSHGGIGKLGASYFTKLLYFFRPENDGYILDQFSGMAINVIFDLKIVRLAPGNDGFFVSKDTTSDEYVNYCKYVELLASEVNDNGEHVEVRLFSYGPKNEWRDYVGKAWRNNRSKMPNAPMLP